MKKLTTLLCWSWLFCPFLFGQLENSGMASIDPSSTQYGFAVKANVEIQKFSNFRVSIAGGLAKRMEAFSFIYPSFHAEVQLYNNGLGTPLNSRKKKLYLDFITSLTLTAGGPERSVHDLNQIVTPLYYFTDFSAQPLQNIYHWSASIGTNYVISNDEEKEAQQVGFVNLNFARHVQVSYYNDGGPPISNLFLGDKFDRYYTSGITISYQDNMNGEPVLFELSFHKFTGYNRYAFELANLIDINYISYKNPSAFYFNQNRWRLGFQAFNQGLGLTASIYNVKNNWDLQNWVHEGLKQTYHPSVQVKEAFGLGVNYQYIKFYSE